MERDPFLTHKMKQARELINFDPLDTAYQQLGDEDAKEAYLLGWHLSEMKEQAKREALTELGDTFYRMPWEAAQEAVMNEGFLVTGHYEMPSSFGDKSYQQFVAAHPEKKLILTAQSMPLDGNDVLDHNMMIHATVDTSGNHDVFMKLMALHGSSSYVGDGSPEDNRFEMSWSVTDGLKITMEDLDATGAQLVEWVPSSNDIAAHDYRFPFYFFGNDYFHRHEHAGEYDEKEAKILADLPDWARAFMHK